jgi:hypothetical protein
MTPPKCPICSTAHYGWQAHTFATNRATNKAATNNATNREAEHQEGARVVGDVLAGANSQRHGDSRLAEGPGDKTPNRRSRAAYNAYQREYMRKRRG